MAKLYADMHCHPTLYGFNRSRNGPDETQPERFNPWATHPENARDMDAGNRGNAYMQCSMAKMVKGRMRVVYLSFTPIEKGFFDGRLNEDSSPFGVELLKLVTGTTLVKSAIHLARSDRQSATHELFSILRNRGPLRRLVQNLYLRYGKKRINYCLSDDYDYWEEFKREYEYLMSMDGIRAQSSFESIVDGQPSRVDVSGTYHAVRNAGHLEDIIGRSDEHLALVLTIEGGYVL
ncbi:MAG: hypothetical protein KC561_10760, partial [Myxococcales bacterium]|nr:hypothetical protein [Myxococcales bacterium]